MKVELQLDDALIVAIAKEVTVRLKPILVTRNAEPAVVALMGVTELAEYLGGVSKDWIYQRTAKNEIPFMKVGRLVKFRQPDIDRWLSSHTIPAVAPLTAPLPGRRTRDSQSRDVENTPCEIENVIRGVK